MTAEQTAGPVAERLRDRVLAASLAARKAGRPVRDAPEIPPTVAFARAADRLESLLAGLSEADWHRTVLRGLDVQGLIGHLVGVEEHVLRCLNGEGADLADADHVAATQAVAVRQLGTDPVSTREAWRTAVDATLRRISSTPDAMADRILAIYGMSLPVGPMLIIRAFELWTHENDIRQVVGSAPSVPDPSTLRLMTDLAMRLLPHGFGRVSDASPTVRMVLTGPGGGTWDVGFGGATARSLPPTRIVADAVSFCRLVANRITPEQLATHVTGDAAMAGLVLAGAATLALD
jgi:uncharacterized protein (TIGR03083 family)